MILDIISTLESDYDLTNTEFSLYPSEIGLNTIKIFDGSKIVYIVKYDNNEISVQDIYDSLSTVFDVLENTTINGTTPQPLSLSTIGETEYMVQSPVPGKPSFSYINDSRRRTRIKRLLEKVVKWLIIFQSAFPEKSRTPEMVEVIPDSYSTSLKSHYFGPMHGDFVTTNVLVANGSVQVIDWEEFEVDGFPLVDLFYFLVDTASKLSDKNPVEYTFYEENWYSTYVEYLIRMYCDLRDVNIRFVRSNIPIYLNYAKLEASKRNDQKRYRQLTELAEEYSAEKVLWS